MKKATVTGLATAAVYVDDFDKALGFYQTYLGFEKLRDMGPDGCWGKVGDLGLYIGKGAKATEVKVGETQVSLVFAVDNLQDFHNQSKTAGFSIDQELMPLGNRNFWFRFRDPAGNLLEAAGEVADA